VENSVSLSCPAVTDQAPAIFWDFLVQVPEVSAANTDDVEMRVMSARRRIKKGKCFMKKWAIVAV